MISENSINIARDSASTETKLSPGKLEKKKQIIKLDKMKLQVFGHQVIMYSVHVKSVTILS